MENKIVKVFEYKGYGVYVSRDGDTSILVQLGFRKNGSSLASIETKEVAFDKNKKLKLYEDLDKEVGSVIVNMIARAKNIQKKITMGDNLLNRIEKKYATK